MKKMVEKSVIYSSIESIVCDICKKEFNCKEDDIELQEFHHINFTGGYGSVFGDGVRVECDICQHCLSKLIVDHARLS